MRLLFLSMLLMTLMSLPVTAGVVVRDQAGTMLADGATADFGTMDLGGTKTLAFHLSVSEPAEGGALICDVDGTDAADFAVELPPINAVAGASAGFSVAYVPAVEGKHSTAALHLRVMKAGGAGSPLFTLNLDAKAGVTLLPVKVEEVGGAAVTPLMAPVDFGSVAVGRSVSKTFRLTNLGSAPLQNVSVQTNDFYPRWIDYNTVFPASIVIGGPIVIWPLYPGSGFTAGLDAGGQIPLPAGASLTFTVVWAPPQTGAVSRSILVNGSNMAPMNGGSTDGTLFLGSAAVSIPVTGSGAAYAYTPTRLHGLHYPLGLRDALSINGGANTSLNLAPPSVLVPAPGQPVFLYGGTTSISDTELALDTKLHWTGADLGTPTPYNWRTLTQWALNLSPTQSPQPQYWLMDKPDGATSVTGSASGLALSGGSGLSNAGLKLPAADNVGVELWLRPSGEEGAASQCVAFVGQAADAGFGLWLVDGVPQGRAGGVTVSAAGPLETGRWHHLAFLMQNGTATLRVDGAAAATAQGVVLPAEVQQLHVGVLTAGSGLEGVVDELRLFEIPADFDPAADLLATAQPVSHIDKAALDFGTSPAGANPASTSRLANAGPGWLRIISATFSGPGAGDFYLGARTVNLQPDPPLPSFTLIASWNLYITPPPAVIMDSTGLTVDGVPPGSPAVALPGSNVMPAAIAPGTAMDLWVQYRGTTPGKRSAMLTLVTNDPAHPVYQVVLNAETENPVPHAEFNGASPWAWGSLLTNASASANFYLNNTGDAPLTDVTVAVEGPDAQDVTLLTNLSQDHTIAAHGGAAFQLMVQPKAAGVRVARLHVTTSDPQNPEFVVPIYGRGELAVPHATYFVDNVQATASGATFNLGGLRLGVAEGSTHTVQVGSTGTASLDNLAFTLLDGPAAADFSFDGTPPVTITPNNVGVVQVKFKPHALGQRKVTLRVTCNDPAASPFDIVLSGQGLPDASELALADPATSFLRTGQGIIDGAPAIEPLRLKNTGTLPLANFTFTITGPQAAEFSAAFPESIAPGAEADVMVTFTPRAIGPRSAVLNFSAKDADGPAQQVRLGGTGAWGRPGQVLNSKRPVANLAAQAVQGWTGTALAALPNGNVLMAGFTEDDGGAKTSRVRELRPDGTETGRITPSFNGEIKALAVQADGAVLVTGQGMGVKRITADGHALDTGFQPPEGDFSGEAVLALRDGKVLVGGDGALGGRKRLIRLKADGSLDDSFSLPEPDAVVHALALQEDGKVLAGGEFTNLGANNDVPPPVPGNIFMLYSPAVLPHTGLCRLTTEGAVDASFANYGFHKVTALAVKDGHVAVAGEETRQYAFIIIATSLYPYYPQPPTYSTESTPTARLLDAAGVTLNLLDWSQTPAAVGLIDGGRMLVTGASATSDINYPYNPSVRLLRPANAPVEWYGEEILSDHMPASNEGTSRVVQCFDNPVRAILPQADGKVLVAGGMTRSVAGLWGASYYDVPGLLPRPTPALPVVVPGPVPDPMPLNGFAQLDVDGFFKPGPAVTLDGMPLSNSLATIPVVPEGWTGTGATLQTTFADPPAASVNGPDAAAFTTDVAAGQGNHTVLIHFTPGRAGPHHAVLHLSSGTAAFDAELTGDGPAALPENFLVVDVTGGEVLDSGGSADFGDVAKDAAVTRHYLVLNGGATAMTSPVNLTLGGAHAADFAVSTASLASLGAGRTATFTVTFHPGTVGSRSATLGLKTAGAAGYPFLLNLSGDGLPSASDFAAFTAQPQDALVAAGAPFTLAAEAASSTGLAWQWYRDGRLVPGARSASLTVAAAKLGDAGSYTVVAVNKRGGVRSLAARVGVVDSHDKAVGVGENKAASFDIKAAGPGLAFQWLRAGTTLKNSAAISGVTTTRLALKRAQASDGGAYVCRASLGALELDSAPVVLDVMPQAEITGGPAASNWMVAVPLEDGFTTSGSVSRFSVTGLPPGVVLDPATGRLSGIPSRAGTYRLRATATNGGGVGPAWQGTVVVRALPAGVLGGFSGFLRRGPFNDSLGGVWGLNVAANGSFTASLRKGSHGAATTAAVKKAGLSGGVVVQALVGRLNFSFEGSVAVGEAEVPVPGGNAIHFVVREDSRSANIMLVSVDDHTDGDGWQIAPSLAPGFVGTYRGDLWDLPLNADAPPKGLATVATTSTGVVNWVVRLAPSEGGNVLTGSSRVDRANQFCLFAVVPNTQGGKSALGQAVLDRSGSAAFCTSSFSWNDTVTPSGEIEPGYLFTADKAR